MKIDFNKIAFLIVGLLIGLLVGYGLFNTLEQSSNSSLVSDATEQPANNSEIYTCSMHPQIRQNEPGDCALCGMDLIPLGADDSQSSNDPLVLKMTPEAVKLAEIQTTIVGEKAGKSGNTIRLSGKVQPDERLASSQVTHVPGRIEKLLVSFTGEQVKQGQKIAMIYSPELIMAQRELLEAVKLQTLNPNLLEAARNKLRYWKISKATIESIEKSGTIQEIFPLYAEESGIVSNKRVSVGDYLQQGEPLFDLMNLQKVWVLFDAYEEDLSTIKVGDRIEFTTPAIANKVFKTRVTFIDPMINPNTRVASIRTEVQNTNALLKPEMLVTGSLQKKATSTAQLTVPKSAVLWTGVRSVVYVKLPEETIPSFEFREIEIGEAQGNSYLVLGGLESGEEVVTNGSFSIDAAAQLNNQMSMINRNVQVKNEAGVVALPDYTEETPLLFKEQLSELALAYLLLKDALVETNSEKAISASTEVGIALAKVDQSLIEANAYLFWIKTFQAMQGHNEKIKSSTDVEEQRRQFDFLSQALIEAIKVFGMTTDTLYVQHCPMVNNNDGADWLSKEEEVRNPYFGDKMLTCGVVKTTIDPTIKNQ